MITFQYFKDRKKEHRWRAKVKGRIIASCAEGYKRREICGRTLARFIAALQAKKYRIPSLLTLLLCATAQAGVEFMPGAQWPMPPAPPPAKAQSQVNDIASTMISARCPSCKQGGARLISYKFDSQVRYEFKCPKCGTKWSK